MILVKGSSSTCQCSTSAASQGISLIFGCSSKPAQRTFQYCCARTLLASCENKFLQLVIFVGCLIIGATNRKGWTQPVFDPLAWHCRAWRIELHLAFLLAGV